MKRSIILQKIWIKYKEDLDRYLKVFKRLQAEQKMDELQKEWKIYLNNKNLYPKN